MPYVWLQIDGDEADLPQGGAPLATLDMAAREIEFKENITVKAKSGKQLIVVAEGAERFVDKTITTAQLLALFATPQQIIAAPGPNKALIFEGAVIHKPAGTAYAGIAVGEDLAIKYTDASGLEQGQAETTGFLDQASAQTRYVKPHTAASAISSITPVANAALVLHLLVGEIITGTSDLLLRVFYRIVPTVLP